MIPNQLPENVPAILLQDRKRLIGLALILEKQTRLPFNHMLGVLEHVYMLGYMQAGVEGAEKIRQTLDAAIAVMGPRYTP